MQTGNIDTRILNILSQIKENFGEAIFSPKNDMRLKSILKDTFQGGNDYILEDIPFYMFCEILRVSAIEDIYASFLRGGLARVGDIHAEFVYKLFKDYGIDRQASSIVLQILAQVAGFSLPVVSVASSSVLQVAPTAIAVAASPSVGDILNFNGISWRILKLAKNDTALCISRDIIEVRPYCDDLHNISWRKSMLRKYLNSTFYRKFARNERNRIIRTDINNPDNPIYGTRGERNTNDHIFCLSINEVMGLFFDIQDRVATYKGQPYWWWLRSVGATNRGTTGVNSDGTFGAYSSLAAGRVSRGVRPALWLRI